MSDLKQLEVLAERAARLVVGISGTALAAAEAACERLELTSEIIQLKERTAAYGAVLESIGSAREALRDQLASASAPVRALLAAQDAALAAQELAILDRAGVPQQAAREAVATDGGSGSPALATSGRRVTRVGAAPANGRTA